MMLKRAISLLMALAVLAAAPVLAESADSAFVVGHTTQMKGDFFTDLFGGNTADIDVRALLHGYELVHWDEDQGAFILDPSVVQKSEVRQNAEGDRIYTLTLQDDLYWSDGTRITAWDYAFSILLQTGPWLEELGAGPVRSSHLKGGDSYRTGAAPCLSGVGVTDELTLVITLDHAYLPYFYEAGLLGYGPYPIRELAPGCRVYSDGESRAWTETADEEQQRAPWYGMGAYIGNEDLSAAGPLFTTELLRETVLDGESGYLSHPKVVSGPYTLESFDGVTARFRANPWFKGALRVKVSAGTEPNGLPVRSGETVLSDGAPAERPDPPDFSKYELVRPQIEEVVFTAADNDTVIRDLLEGRLDLVNKLMYSPAVSAGRYAIEHEDDEDRQALEKLAYTRYPRVGLSFVSFVWEKPAVRETAVRQAIAWCMDRDALTRAYCGESGVRVDGFYGIEQWEYLLAAHRMGAAFNFREEAAAGGPAAHGTAEDGDWAALTLTLTEYTVDTEKAARLLDGAGWTLDRSGGPYDPETDDVRCKMIDGELVALDLTLLYPEGNHIADTMPENWIAHLNGCGILLTLKPAPMPELLRQYYRQDAPAADMIYLATNFDPRYDPAVDLSADRQRWSAVYSDDEQLRQLALDMLRTEPADVYGYMRKWIAFQTRYNEVLPAIPVYSNAYYDFYNRKLENYEITAHVTWSQAILAARLQENAGA